MFHLRSGIARRWLPFAFVTALSAIGAPVAAQTRAPGFALDRFPASDRISDWFALESLDVRGHGRFAVGLVGDFARRPLLIFDSAGNELAAPVSSQLNMHVGATVVLLDRLALSGSLPVVLVNDGVPGLVGAQRVAVDSGIASGDLRVGGDVRLVGRYGQPFSLALGLQAHLPTGRQGSFAGDGKARLVPRLSAAGSSGALAYAAQVSFVGRFRQHGFGRVPFGDEFGFAFAIGARLADGALVIGPEFYGSTVTNDGPVFAANATSIEVLLGGHFTIARAWRVGMGGGPGIHDAIGTPSVRLLASLAYVPNVAESPPPDRDRDGVLDQDDACPDATGARTADPATNGCPDTDRDGFIDAHDACPQQAGVASVDPRRNGCPPPPDTDGDGIVDPLDACPREAGPPSADPKENGCPTDRDGDLILDGKDACPDERGDADPDPKKNGCPKTILLVTEIKILERIEFDTDQATIRPESESILHAIVRVLNEHPEIGKVRVEGHTDGRGGAPHNRKLSQQRAESVVAWLSGHGVDAARLVPVGYGPDRPIEENRTAEGRKANRRVQFMIVEKDGKPIGNP